MSPEQVRLLSIVFGVIVCCFGWTIYWGSVRFFGAIVGLILGTALGLAFVIIASVHNEVIRIIILGILGIGGIFLGRLFFQRLHYLFFFAIGALLGVVIATVVMEDFLNLLIKDFPSASTLYRILVKISFAAFLGLLFALISKLVVVTTSALLGTWLIAQGIVKMIPENWLTPVLITIFLTSFVLQLGLLQKFKPEPVPPKKKSSKKDDDDE